MQTAPPRSLYATAACLTALVAFFLSTLNIIAPILMAAIVLSHIIGTRFSKDSGAVWGVRLLLYGVIAAMGRESGDLQSYYRAFTTAGLICGAEMVLQAYREPPPGARFHGVQILCASLVWLIAANVPSWRVFHLFVLSPIFIALALFSLRDLRPNAPKMRFSVWARGALLIGIAAALGAFSHQEMWANRGHIMALGANLLSDRINAPQNAGIGDSPRLESSFGNGQSTSRLLKIEGPITEPHLRAAAFDVYLNDQWGPSISSRQLEAALDPDLNLEAKGAKIEVTLLRQSNGVLFAPLNAKALIPSEGSSFDWSQFNGPFTTTDNPPYHYQYIEGDPTTDELPSITQGPLCVKPTAEQRQALLVVPAEVDPQVQQTARLETLEANTAPEKAEMLLEFLMKNNSYSLTFDKGDGDPVSAFILEKRSGHCQFFASSMTIMLRSVGIPARYVTGFYAHESDGPNATVVRGRDAHAWSEAYFEGIGWVTIEATPPAGRADPKVAPLPFWQKPMEQLQDWWTQIRAKIANLTAPQIIGILVIMMVLWGLERWRLARKARRQQEIKAALVPELAPLAHRFERVLAKHGITLVEGQPWSETLTEEWQDGREWVGMYNRARFAELSPQIVRELEKKLTQLEKKS